MKTCLSQYDAARMSQLRRRSCSRFTLIEMLTVVTIVMILASLLLPSLRKAMDSSYRVGCVNNLKMIAVGIDLYADEYASWLPPRQNFYVNASGYMAPWFTQEGLLGIYWGENGGRYRSTAVALCPAAHPDYRALNKTSSYGRNYTSGCIAGPNGQPTQAQWPWRRRAEIRHPSAYVQVCDALGGDWFGGSTDQYSGWPEKAPGDVPNSWNGTPDSRNWCQRHQQSAAVAFGDGHVGGSSNFLEDNQMRRLTQHLDRF